MKKWDNISTQMNANIYTYLKYCYESKFFGGDVNYFVDNVPLPNNYDYWTNIEPYKSCGNVVEDILVTLLNNTLQ